MNIVVLVKQVPDSGAERMLSAADNTVERGSANNVINEMDEYAIEEALKIKEAHGGEVTVLTMGPERATESIRKALSMGPDKAVHITDDALHGSCAVATASTPAIVSVWDTINEPRYPSFKGIMAAKKKPVQTLSLADLGVPAGDVGFAGATSEVVEFAKRPPRSAGTKIVDEG